MQTLRWKLLKQIDVAILSLLVLQIHILCLKGEGSGDLALERHLEEVKGVYRNKNLVPMGAEKIVLITSSNFGYRYPLLNWICHAKRLDLDYLIFATDSRLFHYLRSLRLQNPLDYGNLRVIAPFESIDFQNSQINGRVLSNISQKHQDRHNQAEQQQDHLYVPFGQTSSFQRVTCAKFTPVHRLLGLGYDILFADADLVLVQNPLVGLFPTPCSLLFQPDGCGRGGTGTGAVRKTYGRDRVANSGFYFIRSNAPSYRLFSQALHYCHHSTAYAKRSDQYIINVALELHQRSNHIRYRDRGEVDLAGVPAAAAAAAVATAAVSSISSSSSVTPLGGGYGGSGYREDPYHVAAEAWLTYEAIHHPRMGDHSGNGSNNSYGNGHSGDGTLRSSHSLSLAVSMPLPSTTTTAPVLYCHLNNLTHPIGGYIINQRKRYFRDLAYSGRAYPCIVHPNCVVGMGAKVGALKELGYWALEEEKNDKRREEGGSTSTSSSTSASSDGGPRCAPSYRLPPPTPGRGQAGRAIYKLLVPPPGVAEAGAGYSDSRGSRSRSSIRGRIRASDNEMRTAGYGKDGGVGSGGGNSYSTAAEAEAKAKANVGPGLSVLAYENWHEHGGAEALLLRAS